MSCSCCIWDLDNLGLNFNSQGSDICGLSLPRYQMDTLICVSMFSNSMPTFFPIKLMVINWVLEVFNKCFGSLLLLGLHSSMGFRRGLMNILSPAEYLCGSSQKWAALSSWYSEDRQTWSSREMSGRRGSGGKINQGLCPLIPLFLLTRRAGTLQWHDNTPVLPLVPRATR